MKVENGKFYFIKDEFFSIFKDYKLMENKENGNKRPCYFCFNDMENEEIIWFVPISSKVEKYKSIYENKKKARKKVYNFVFGKVLGKEKAFLIQNIFPTTEFSNRKFPPVISTYAKKHPTSFFNPRYIVFFFISADSPNRAKKVSLL